MLKGGVLEGRVVKEVVVTGGPCGGKSTGLAVLATSLRERGWRVLVVPEAATMYITGGVPDIQEVAGDPRRFLGFQAALLSTQRALRTQFRRMAEELGDGRTVVLYDRAELDNRAYLGPEAFERLLEREGLDPLELRDSYDAVVHMVSAAKGAEEHYTLANNDARTETPEQARRLDDLTLAAWVGHRRLVVVGNEGSFEEKLSSMLEQVLDVVGAPEPVRRQRKFLLRGPVPEEELLAAGAVRSSIEHHHLLSAPGTQVRLRRQDEGSSSVFTRTVRRDVSPGVRTETAELVSADEHRRLLDLVDPDTAPVEKTRWSLVAGTDRVVVDHVTAPVEVWLAEIDGAREERTLPDLLAGGREVTGDPEWTSDGLSRRGRALST